MNYWFCTYRSSERHIVARRSANGGVNKSQAIRELYAANPKMTVKKAIKELADKGIEADSNQVYFVLGGVKGKAKRKKGQRAAAMSAVAMSSAAIPIEAIAELRSLATKVGGLANLKRLVDVLME
jgi:hypothetical protein